MWSCNKISQTTKITFSIQKKNSVGQEWIVHLASAKWIEVKKKRKKKKDDKWLFEFPSETAQMKKSADIVNWEVCEYKGHK